MRALYKSLLVTTLCVAVSVFMLDGVSHAKKGGNSGSKVKIDVRAELEPFDGSPEEDAEGKARHKKETRTRDGVTTTKKDEFKATVKIPVDPASALGIVDEDAAEDADIRLILSRDGANFAECLLEFQEIEDDDEAEFKVDVRIKKGALREKKGMCTMTADGSHVVPDAQAGDVATATHVAAGGTRTDFLRGTFEQHH